MLTALLLFLLASAWASKLQTPLLVTYWGQDPIERPLRSYCDQGYNVVVLGFIDQFGNETFHMQMNSASCSTNETSGCAEIASNISYCQQHGVKILMSMGGATVHDCPQSCTGIYRFDSIDEANRTAEEMYYMFFAGTTDPSYWRPFGDVQLDGVDLDIEETPEGDQTYQKFYDNFISRLRELQSSNDLIVSAAPECHHGCAAGNCNALEQAVNQTEFDYLFVQFYNDPNCGLLQDGFNSSLGYWLNLQGPSSNTIIVLGVPGDNRSSDVVDPMYYVDPGTVVSIYQDKQSQNPRVNGIGIWQASTDVTNPQFFPVIQKGLGRSENTASTTTPSPTNPPTTPPSPPTPTTTSSKSDSCGRYHPSSAGGIVLTVLLGLLVGEGW